MQICGYQTVQAPKNDLTLRRFQRHLLICTAPLPVPVPVPVLRLAYLVRTLEHQYSFRLPSLPCFYPEKNSIPTSQNCVLTLTLFAHPTASVHNFHMRLFSRPDPEVGFCYAYRPPRYRIDVMMQSTHTHTYVPVGWLSQTGCSPASRFR